MKFHLRDVPTRLTIGAYVFHSGQGKWNVSPEHAAGLHGMAAGAYPFLKSVPSTKFVKGLAAAEMALGALIVTPFVPNRLAGLALTAFSGGLLGMYMRTPALHEPGSIWPTQAGIGVSKDVWMLGVGLGLVIDV